MTSEKDEFVESDKKIKGPMQMQDPLEDVDFKTDIFIGPWSLGKPTFCCKP